jgi:hypothetical protein
MARESFLVLGGDHRRSLAYQIAFLKGQQCMDCQEYMSIFWELEVLVPSFILIHLRSHQLNFFSLQYYYCLVPFFLPLPITIHQSLALALPY